MHKEIPSIFILPQLYVEVDYNYITMKIITINISTKLLGIALPAFVPNKVIVK